MRAFTISLFLFIAYIYNVNGQDAQFSQFYNAPLYLNPAFTGTALQSRAIANYRNQWPGIGKPFITYAASFDHYFANYNSGVGLMIMQDKAGSSKLKSTNVSALYSYFIELNGNWTFIPGLQATFVQRNIDYSSVTFPDQLNSTGLVGETSENLNYTNKRYADFSTGGLLYSEIFWFGASYHHLNRPNQSFSPEDSKLPGEINLHAGARIPFASSPKGRSSRILYKEKAIVPSILYKSQGKFDQLDLGIYVLYQPLLIGVWYRGLPVKHYAAGFTNAESIIGMIGINTKNNLTIGYSYDFVISRLNMRTAGAHEISLIFLFGNEQMKNKKRTKYKTLPCPGFYKKPSKPF